MRALITKFLSDSTTFEYTVIAVLGAVAVIGSVHIP
jgi:Flp pilus assembly pilin Flp